MAQPQLVSKDEQIREAPQLRPFLLRDVRRTGKTLHDRGLYGTVEELEMAGLVCVGKKMNHVGPSDQGTRTMVDRYYNQCRSLSELRHPHIVHFLGICFFPDSLLPVLVTERLHSTLDDMLGQYTEIPLYVKLSVLHDVTKGLLFLHTRNPAVVHRALTARNVLLDATMTAKIADLDNSKSPSSTAGSVLHASRDRLHG